MAKKVVLQMSPKGPTSPREMLKAFDLRNVRDSLILYQQAPRHDHDKDLMSLLSGGKFSDALELLNKHSQFDLAYTDAEGNTALHLSVIFRKLNLIQRLVRLGADQDIINLKEQTPLDIAKENQFTEIVLYLDAGVGDALSEKERKIKLADVVEEVVNPGGALLLPRPALMPSVDSILPLEVVEEEEEEEAALPKPPLVRMLSVLPLLSSGVESEDAGNGDAPSLLQPPFSMLSILPPISSGMESGVPPLSLRAEFGDYNDREIQITGSSASLESGDESSSS